ncbi:MAG TPA: hypothetical protein VH277_08890, partial [Gemmatimonadaceae bacterium]|nr:hypothetical protein [Gemmatimonadaceae bacterium]
MKRLERIAWMTLLTAIAMVLAGARFVRPGQAAPVAPFAMAADDGSVEMHSTVGPREGHFTAAPSANAFGASHAVHFRFAMPAAEIEFPLDVSGDPTALTYEWVAALDTNLSITEPRPVSGATFVAPSRPGYYHLLIRRGVEREIIGQPMLAVMVPFRNKVGSMLNGYRIGTYIAERLGRSDHPPGFLEVHRTDLALHVSTHLRLGDFITHDGQANVWPKYVALSPRLLDKLELVLAKVGSRARFTQADTDDASQDVAFDVHSGFRTPAHNGGVWKAARDSRHQYGDAADVAIDADGD